MTAKVYSKQLTPAQNAALARYETLSSIPPTLGLEDLEAHTISPAEFWQRNVRWLQDVANDVGLIQFPS